MKIWTLGGVFATCNEKLAWNMVPSTIFLPRELVAFQHQSIQFMSPDEEEVREEPTLRPFNLLLRLLLVKPLYLGIIGITNTRE